MEKIGVCDWGIGGIGMIQHLRKHKNYDIVYLSDAGFTPYGKVSSNDLTQRWQEVKTFYKNHGISKIAIACNALSTVVEKNENFITVIDSGIDMAQSIGPKKKIGITGGFRTVESNAYKTPLDNLGHNIIQSVGQVLSAKVEAGDLNSEETIEFIKQVFNPLETCDCIILACTHYPVLEKQILLNFPQLTLLDPAFQMSKIIANTWKENGVDFNIEWYTTGNVETMIKSARISFDETVLNPIKTIL